MKTLLPFLATAALLAGCATQAPDVTTHHDKFSTERADVMEDILLKGPTEPPRELLWLNATRYSKEFSSAPIFLGIDYMARTDTGLLDIEPGQTLTVTADGTSYKFTGTGSLNTRQTVTREGQEFVQEGAIYQIKPSQLMTISQAKQVQVQVKGKNGLVQRNLDEKAMDRLRRFVAHLAI
jgi:hypothetical protein